MLNLPKKVAYKYCLDNEIILSNGEIIDTREWINELTDREKSEAVVKNPEIMQYIDNPSHDLIITFMNNSPQHHKYVTSDDVIKLYETHLVDEKDRSNSWNYKIFSIFAFVIMLEILYFILFLATFISFAVLKGIK